MHNKKYDGIVESQYNDLQLEHSNEAKMEWLAIAMASIAFVFVLQEMEKSKKLEERVKELEDKWISE